MLIALSSCDGGSNSTSGTKIGVEVGDSTFGVKDHKDGETKVTILDPQEPELPVEVTRPRQKLAHYVNTMRGANSSGDFTRGNTFPATAVPFGFNFWTPINRQDKNWFYQFRTTTGYPTDGGNLIDKVTDFAVVHEPSPWIGNRQSLSIMPISNTSETSHGDRGETFSRANEIAKAHYYSLKFDNGVRTEITPTERAAVFRFTAAEGSEVQTILFDRFARIGTGDLQIIDLEKGIIQGFTDFRDNKNAPPLYFYVIFNSPIKSTQKLEENSVKQWVQFDVSKNSVIEMRIGTSFMSVEQAKANLASEVGPKSFDQVKDEAEALWDDRLNMIHVEGATEDQKIILYSNIYRSFLYPNAAYEYVDGKPEYMSPYIKPIERRSGKTWVNNGFWDTYRTTWPLYALFDPKQAGEMIDGFVNAYKDGGWVPRWSGPDYRDSMVSTSSDIIFADAFAKGVKFDFNKAYESMVKNATTYSSDAAKGRKGMNRTPYLGYSTLGHEDVAWSLEAYLNDFGVAEMAKALGKNDDAAYFYNSAISYSNIFDRTGSGSWSGGFFRQKDAQGNFGSGSSYPAQWGYGYTEGNAWSYAFLAPHDGEGLASLYGGRKGLKERLDQFFTTKPSTARDVHGSYWTVIHEIKEARAVNELAGVGEYQHSNQPVHHSIYMYNFAGSPSSGQKYLRDVMDKLYFSGFDANGNSDGSGYIGDEDNGEQSAWYIFSAMGFYPVAVGRAEYAIGAPYFPKMNVAFKREDGSESVLEILAPSVSTTNRYVQSVTLNGKAITRNYLLHSEIANGGKLEFVMGPNPSVTWGTGENDVPSSITKPGVEPKPLKSAVPAGKLTLSSNVTEEIDKLSDRNSLTKWVAGQGANFIEAKAATDAPVTAKIYTLTSSENVSTVAGWTLKGSNDAANWEIIDKRQFSAENPAFKWPRQLRPFSVKDPKSFRHYRIEFDGATPIELGELEFLAELD